MGSLFLTKGMSIFLYHNLVFIIEDISHIQSDKRSDNTEEPRSHNKNASFTEAAFRSSVPAPSAPVPNYIR